MSDSGYLCNCDQGEPDGTEISHYSYRIQILLIVAINFIVFNERPSVTERLLLVWRV